MAGNMRPNPAGSRPDAGAYEDSLARGAFGIQVSTCGYMISTTVLNSDAYSVNVTSTNGFNSTEENALVALKGTYNVTVYDHRHKAGLVITHLRFSLKNLDQILFPLIVVFATKGDKVH